MSDTYATVKSSETVFEGRIFDVKVDQVEYPDGRAVKMDVIRHRGSVVLIPMPTPTRVILVRQYRYVVDKWLWEFPAGKIDEGEDLEAAARRECHEEIGQIADHARRLASFFPTPGFCDEQMTFFIMSGLRDRRADEAAAAQDPDELLTVKELSIAEARQMVRNEEIVDMKTALGLTMIE